MSSDASQTGLHQWSVSACLTVGQGSARRQEAEYSLASVLVTAGRKPASRSTPNPPDRRPTLGRATIILVGQAAQRASRALADQPPATRRLDVHAARPGH